MEAAPAANHQPVYSANILSGTFGWPTMYEILVDLPNNSRVVQRRYRDFEQLHNELEAAQSSATSSLPQLPRKGSVSMMSNSFRETRQEGLANYLTAVILAFPALESDALATFLEASPLEREAVRVAWASHGSLDTRAVTVATEYNVAEASAPSLPISPVVEVNSGPRSEMDEIREMRRRRWLEQQGGPPAPDVSATSSQAQVRSVSSAAPAPVLAASPAQALAAAAVEPPAAVSSAAPRPLSVLSRICILPMQDLPPEYHDERQRMQLLKEPLRRHKNQAIPIESGTVLESNGFRFAVIKCDPASPGRGIIDSETQYFLEGPTLSRLRRVQMTGLVRHGPGQDEDVFRQYIAPHLRTNLADPTRCQVVRLYDTPRFSGVPFYVQAIDPNDQGWGIIDNNTEIFASRDEVSEFDRIHVVPFSDTLPSAYDFDVFQDYVKPYFASHLTERFQEGQSFYHNGVHFKVVACDPPGPRRVGNSTEVYSDGRLHPTAAELLTPDQARHLSLFPAGIQMLLLQTNLFGSGDIADRIMEAQGQHSRNRQTGLSQSALENLTQEDSWSEDLRRRLDLEQTECIVCLSDFQDGDRVRCLPCKHVFHTACIDEWLGRDAHCPLCRNGLQQGSRRRGWGT